MGREGGKEGEVYIIYYMNEGGNSKEGVYE